MSQIVSTSPQAPSDVVVQAPDSDAAEVAAAVERTRAAGASWARRPATERAAALSACAEALAGAADEVAGLVVREVGKPVAEARGEVARGVAIMRYFAQAALLPEGDVFPASDSVSLLHTRRRPHGVAGLITPWNFPVAIPLWKAAPALAFGNGVVLKPAEQSPAVALRLAELFGDALPLTVVTGGGAAGAALVESADVVSFTGSTAVGRRVRETAAARGIPVQCEMGGQNPSVVLADADLDAAARTIAGAAMGYAGQKCTATSRVIVVGDADDFAQRLAAAVEALSVGDPADPGTVAGPVIDEGARDAVVDAARRAAGRGAKVLTGGAALDRDGFFVAPTVVTAVPDGDTLLTDEIFGPICAVVPAASPEAAIEAANGVRQGLVAALFTRDLTAALTLAPRFETGMVKVNAPTAGVDFHAPFGGDKDSSYGPREQGPAARDFYTTTVTITLTPA
ncbi:aldehyde dehydrogenase family protein [Phytohabitans aurantiacus]|uniref:Aldehyde dehydrogenase n=1 Tax=Phytohabitans aurantiacus TaxID=3016789 RepID=A0ABQ5R4N3_9ACTN|nr:aldehyde dehydrogenase family protein [Phytohabitans aurantiacus]GLI01508.1 aldehyde dehydrogenase [Phytohabitans aurantiacus]